MSRFAIISADNEVVGIAISAAALQSNWIPVPQGLAVGSGWAYRDGNFIPPVAQAPVIPTNQRINPYALFARLTQAEEVSLELALWINPNDTIAARRTSAQLKVRKAAILGMSTVKLTMQKVVNYFNDLETSGVLAAGRAAQILSAPVTDAEVTNG